MKTDQIETISTNKFYSWFKEENSIDENNLRPKTIQNFIGQEQLKKNISLFIEATKLRNEALDHVFLSGGPGLGKTTLACIIANELQVDIKISNAPAIEKPKDLIGILSTLSENSVLFLDEIHRLRSPVEEILYVAMEDFMLDWIIGSGPDARTVRIPLNKFTLIGATTQPGKVSSPLHSRFGIKERLDLYHTQDLKNIIQRTAQILKIEIENEAADYLGSISRGTPRYANRLIKRIRDFAQVQGIVKINLDLVKNSVKELGIDEMGLEEIDRRILKVLINDYKGQAVGLKTLAIAVNEAPESLEDFWEQNLITQGLLQRTPQGRKATPKAWQLFGTDSLYEGSLNDSLNQTIF